MFKELIENTKLIKDLDELFNAEEIDEKTLHDSRELLFESLGENIDSLNDYKIKLDNKINECKEIKERYVALEKHYEKKRDRLNEFLLSIMNNMKTDKLLGNVGYIKKKETKQVNILDIEKIPKEYIDIKITKNPKKLDIRKAIENGAEIEGACIIKNEGILYK